MSPPLPFHRLGASLFQILKVPFSSPSALQGAERNTHRCSNGYESPNGIGREEEEGFVRFVLPYHIRGGRRERGGGRRGDQDLLGLGGR